LPTQQAPAAGLAGNPANYSASPVTQPAGVLESEMDHAKSECGVGVIERRLRYQTATTNQMRAGLNFG